MATNDLTPGLKAEIVTTVDDRLVVRHMGGDGVLSTPPMIGLMERAGIEAVQAHLPEGHTTVGFEVHVKHFGATPKGIRVNAIAPGPIVTDLTATMTPGDRQAFIDALPVGRFGRPEEIAATALLLAGPDGGFYVGATLSPNGRDVMY